MNNIKYFRQRNGLTVRRLSKQADVAIGYISDLENDSNDVKNPTKDVMVKISEALGQTVSDVFFSNYYTNLVREVRDEK